MLHFAQEVVEAWVHGVIALLCLYCAMYNFIRGHKYRAMFYAVAVVFECYAIYLHLQDAFGKEVEHES